ASKADAAARAWAADCSACAAAFPSQPAYGAAAFAIDTDDGPCQASAARSAIVELKVLAAELNSLPMPSQAAAASSMGAEPGPSINSPELTSGGHTEKFIAALL